MQSLVKSNHLTLINRITSYPVRHFNGNRCVVTRIDRQKKMYLRQYPTCMMMPDGSSFTFRHTDPRRIINVPLTLDDCRTEEEKKEWLQRRKKIEKAEIHEDLLDVKYDKKKYLKFLKRK